MRPSYRPNLRELLDPKVMIYMAIALLIGFILFSFFVGKASNFKKNYRKKYLTYIWSLVGISLFIPFLGTTDIIKEVFDEFVFYQVIYLILGIVHVNLFYNYFDRFGLQTKGPWMEILFSFIVMLFISIPFLISFTFFRSIDFAFIMTTSLLPFVVPTFFFATYVASISIPAKYYSTWQFPPFGTYAEPTDEDYRDMVVLTFSFNKSPFSNEVTEFRAKSPLRMDFGKLFYHFVYDYNERNPESPIILEDENGQLQHWVFYLKPTWYSSSKYLKPEYPLYMNGVEENSVIYCVRTLAQSQPDEEGWVDNSVPAETNLTETN